jgi:polysaccharide pyruvyl transferase WcaK-like protein
MEAMKKIAVIGGYGHFDIGDESQLTADLANLREFVPHVQLFVLSSNPENTRRYHKVPVSGYPRELFLNFRSPRFLTSLVKGLILLFNVHRVKKGKNLVLLSDKGKRFFQELESTSLLFNVGGGNLTSVWPGTFYRKCMLYILCRILGKPVILSGQTIGPFYGWFDKRLANFALNRVNVITLRERFSKDVLQKVGVTKPLIRVTADDSILLPPAPKKKVEEVYSKEKIPRDHPLIAVNMIRLSILPPSKLKKGKKILAQIADHLISKYDTRIVFVPMQYAPNADDRIAAFEVLKLMKHKNEASILMHEYDDRTLKAVIGHTDLAIGFRYHFTVFAVNMGVPAIGIYSGDYYSVKIKGILELMGQRRYACDLEKTSFNDLKDLVEHTLANKETICKLLKKRTKQLQNQSLLSIKYAAKLVSEKPSSNKVSTKWI